jgi:hypothetical protein
MAVVRLPADEWRAMRDLMQRYADDVAAWGGSVAIAEDFLNAIDTLDIEDEP